MMDYRKLLSDQPVIPAPMCGISDFAWREGCREMGARFTFTQMVSSEGLVRGDSKTRDILDIREPESLLGIQVFGSAPDTLADSVKILMDLNPAVIDLNMGCPARKITTSRAGSALLRDLPRVARIFRAVRRVIPDIPFTAKMRWDWDDDREAALGAARIAEAEGLDAIALHARTRAQGYSGCADWTLIHRLKQAVGIPVIGNGDIRTPADALDMKRQSGCDAVMIGRALIGDPWLLRETLDALKAGHACNPRSVPDWETRREVMMKHARRMLERKGPRGLVVFRKHAAAYLRGLTGAKKLRVELMHSSTLEQFEALLYGFDAGC